MATKVQLFSWFPLMFFTMFILVLNILIMVVFIKKQEIRNCTLNILLFNQALIDLFISITFIPFYAVSKYHQEWDSSSFLFSFFVISSIINIISQSIERYSIFHKTEKAKHYSKLLRLRIYSIVTGI